MTSNNNDRQMEWLNRKRVDRVYRALKSRILQCEFHPGDFLAGVDLARRCDTSRTPVREVVTAFR